ncbi:hypothetical protein H257_14663 [Aphanomyces astaci]|uniref:Uncharacterized protein n=1 Tax=Aphanomyces astaci TaxID=112090 RepID=W4FQ91_APHAT|nr:hypothetical protein H257_14663 [Aphanomyces astaci]ETV69640.1 hypothetical protein H257_14663 [Aphanomyces astaci]|eukprot:XP_009840856.1 hypothetical protein H257_14663 [Aphanomyces astaci]
MIVDRKRHSAVLHRYQEHTAVSAFDPTNRAAFIINWMTRLRLNNALTEQKGAETEEDAPTAELEKVPTSGTSTMQPIEDETKEEHPSP